MICKLDPRYFYFWSRSPAPETNASIGLCRFHPLMPGRGNWYQRWDRGTRQWAWQYSHAITPQAIYTVWSQKHPITCVDGHTEMPQPDESPEAALLRAYRARNAWFTTEAVMCAQALVVLERDIMSMPDIDTNDLPGISFGDFPG